MPYYAVKGIFIIGHRMRGYEEGNSWKWLPKGDCAARIAGGLILLSVPVNRPIPVGHAIAVASIIRNTR